MKKELDINQSQNSTNDNIKFAPHIPEGSNIPHEVIGLMVKRGFSLVRAWREYLGLTQQEVAGRMNITQGALSQIEEPGKRIRKATLEKLAMALGISIEQLRV